MSGAPWQRPQMFHPRLMLELLVAVQLNKAVRAAAALLCMRSRKWLQERRCVRARPCGRRLNCAGPSTAGCRFQSPMHLNSRIIPLLRDVILLVAWSAGPFYFVKPNLRRHYHRSGPFYPFRLECEHSCV